MSKLNLVSMFNKNDGLLNIRIGVITIMVFGILTLFSCAGCILSIFSMNMVYAIKFMLDSILLLVITISMVISVNNKINDEINNIIEN